MCGIVGIVRFDGASVDARRLERAIDALAHRGPDDRGVYVSEVTGVGLGHRRLSILDLSPAGRQPMVGCRPDLMITFNGEIYNYKTLRMELDAAGYRFRSDTDTEVLLHTIDRWGDGAAGRLNGMFAYAALDERAGTLTLVRDRHGIKPLYYHLDHRALVFASEVKAIIATGLYRPELLIDALPEYLTFRTVAGERTLFRNVLELNPGSTLTVNLRNGHVQQRRFHEIRVAPGRMVEDEAVAALRVRLSTAVGLQLQSDVPVGGMNSGGLDSSVVAALAVEHGGPGFRTYCASYGGAEGGAFDESEYATLLAQCLGTRHREVAIGPQEFFELIEPTCWLFDEPLSHPNSIPLFKVFRAAREDGVKVMLSGEGGDEMLAGYDFFTEIAVIDLLARSRMARGFPWGLRFAARLAGGARWAGLVDGWLRDGAGAILDVVAVERQTGLRPEERWGPCRTGLLERFGADLFAAGSEYVQRVYLSPLLQRSDRMSMASGVECRVPYLDNEVAELANRLPRRLKRRLFPRRVGKVALRRVAAGLVPTQIIARAKYGFAAPVGAWMRSTAPGRQTLAVLREPRSKARPWAIAGETEQLTHDHDAGVRDLSRRLWTLLTLELWARRFLDGDRQGAAVVRTTAGAGGR